MEEDKEFSQLHASLSNHVNSMRSLGEEISETNVVRKVFRSLPKMFRPRVMTTKESKDVGTIKLGELIGSLQTYEAFIKEPTKKKGIALKVEEPSGSNKETDEELALVANRFKKFFRRNITDFSKNKYVEKVYHNYRKNKYSFREPSICYECKGRGHVVEDYGNKKYKPKGKVMVTTWDDDSDESEQETHSSEEDASQEIKTFMAYGSSLSLFRDSNNSSSDSDGENEEGDEDIQKSLIVSSSKVLRWRKRTNKLGKSARK